MDYAAPPRDGRALVALAHHCHARGWSLATSGNYSVRVAERGFWITPSGFDKGLLTVEHLLWVDPEGRVLVPGVPSAETLLHAQIYRRWPQIHCVAHTHSLAATLISRVFAEEGCLTLSGFEIAKALNGIDSHEATVHLPIFTNDQDVGRLAAHIDEKIGDDSSIHGYLLVGHGLYTWGRNVAETQRHVEALEFLLNCALHAGYLPRGGA